MRPEFKEAVKIAATGEYKCIPVSHGIICRPVHTADGTQKAEKCKQTLLHAGISGGQSEVGALHISGI